MGLPRLAHRRPLALAGQGTAQPLAASQVGGMIARAEGASGGDMIEGMRDGA
jgi:hypothetical protein